MQNEFEKRNRHLRIITMMLMLIVLCVSCKDDNSGTDSHLEPFDPSKPVIVSDFLPKEGGAYQKMVNRVVISLSSTW